MELRFRLVEARGGPIKVRGGSLYEGPAGISSGLADTAVRLKPWLPRREATVIVHISCLGCSQWCLLDRVSPTDRRPIGAQFDSYTQDQA